MRLAIACAVLCSTTLSAQLSPKYQRWGDTAVQYLMTKQEKVDWNAMKSDADAEEFINLFWARRDPTPDTPVNELRDQIEKRIAEADKRFGYGKTAGSQTDPGLVYVLFGKPTQVDTTATRRPNTSYESRRFDRPINVQMWTYRSAAAEQAIGTNAFDIAFVFQDEKFAARYELDGQSRLSFDSMALVIAKSILKRPFLTSAELGGKKDATVALGLIVVGDGATANDIVRRTQEGEDFAALAKKFSTHHSAAQGGYLGRIPFAELDADFKIALAGRKPGAAVVIERKPLFAVVKLLTDAEAAAADAQPPK